jgi:hypothetical protein
MVAVDKGSVEIEQECGSIHARARMGRAASAVV